MSDRNEILQQMSIIYDDFMEAKSDLNTSRLKYKDAITRHNNFDLEISRLTDELKYGDPTKEFEIISKIYDVCRQDREIEESLPDLCKIYQDNCARFNELTETMNKIIVELKNFAEEE